MAFVPRDGRPLIGRAKATAGQKDSAEAMPAQAILLRLEGGDLRLCAS
jgi:hypothetical protein